MKNKFDILIYWLATMSSALFFIAGILIVLVFKLR